MAAVPLLLTESKLADWAVMGYSTPVLQATEIATFFLSLKHGDLQMVFLAEG